MQVEKDRCFYTGTFVKLPEEKQRHILETAKTEFARRGFQSANINTIAEKAGISIGALYRYFKTKEDLYLTVIETGLDVLCNVLEEAMKKEGDIYDGIENILYAAYHHSRKDPEMIRIYIDCTGENLAGPAKKLSRRMETLAAETYARWVRNAKEKGNANPALDNRIAAFFLDNLFLMFQFSFAGEYYHERMKIFTGRGEEQVKELIDGLMLLIRYGLAGRSA